MRVSAKYILCAKGVSIRGRPRGDHFARLDPFLISMLDLPRKIIFMREEYLCTSIHPIAEIGEPWTFIVDSIELMPMYGKIQLTIVFPSILFLRRHDVCIMIAVNVYYFAPAVLHVLDVFEYFAV